jgi:hypothetical protein
LGSRLVLLSLIGTDSEIAASASAWLAIRRGLKVEANPEMAASDFAVFANSQSRTASLFLRTYSTREFDATSNLEKLEQKT